MRRTASTWGKLCQDGLRGEAGFKPVDGDVVCPGPNLDQESFLGVLEDEVGAVIERLQWRYMAIMTDEKLGDVVELVVYT